MRHCGRRLPAIFFNPLQPLIALLLRRDMTKPVIRTAQVKDLASIQSIYAIEVREYTATFEITPPDVEEMTIRWRHIADTGLPYLVAELDGEIVGYAYACSYRSRSAYSHTVEDSVYVARDKHRQGLGRALLTELIHRCQDLGKRQMIAIIGDSSHNASIRLHEKAGFRSVGTLEQVGWKLDRWIDSVIMQRSLVSGSDDQVFNCDVPADSIGR